METSETMGGMNPIAVGHLPSFVTAPGQTDLLFAGTVVVILILVLLLGTLYLTLHALPERIAHGGSKVQLQVVAVLALIALFTHNHLFWIAALLLALVPIPDFSTPIRSIAQSLQKMADRDQIERPATPDRPKEGIAE